MTFSPTIVDPAAIEAESFRIIEAEAGPHPFSVEEWPVVRRVIHTSADFEFIKTMIFSPDALSSAVAALRRGAQVCSDTNMILAGVSKERLRRLDGEIVCHVADIDVAATARSEGVTRSIVATRKGVAEGSDIWLIGNAPTALFELLRLVRDGAPRPALVVGVPVGFVGAAESKEALLASDLPFITCRGRKGGSTIAVAILNALMILAEDRP